MPITSTACSAPTTSSHSRTRSCWCRPPSGRSGWTRAMPGASPEPIKGQFGNVKRVFGALGNKPTQYEAGKALAPGITAMATPGHTPGHTSYVVASGSDKVLLQVDVTAAVVSLFLNHPEWKLSFDTDGPLAEQTRRKVYDMAIADNMPIQGYHFPFPGRGYVEKAGSGYRLVPAAWSPTI